MGQDLVEACRVGDSRLALALLSQNPNSARFVDEDGRIPLHWASAGGDLTIVEQLLAAFPDGIKARDAAMWTPLMISVSAGRSVPVQRTLIAASAAAGDLLAANTTGVTSLHLAASKCQPEAANLLIAHAPELVRVRDKQMQQPLHRAAAAGAGEIVRALLEARAPKNASDIAGWTALHHACAEAHGDVAVSLLRAGVDPARVDRDDKTAVQLCPDTRVREYIVRACEQEGIDLR